MAALPLPEPTSVPLRVLFRRVLALARPHWKRLGVALVLSVLGSAVSLVVPLGLRELIDAVFGTGDRALLDRIAVLLLVLFVVQTVVGFVGSYWMEWVGLRVIADLRTQLYRHLHRLGLPFFTSGRVGDITSRLTNDVTKLQAAATSDLASLLSQSLSLVGGVALMVVLNWRLSLVIFAVVPVVTGLAIWFGRIIRRLARRVQDRLADATAVAEEALSAVRVVKAFARERHEVGRYGAAVEEVFDTGRQRALASAGLWSLVGFLFFTGLVAIFWYGGTEVLADRLTAGDLVAFIFYALTIATSVTSLSRLYTSFSGAAGASERVFEILDTEPDLRDAPDARPIPRLRGAVAFEDVTFAYEPGRPVLRDVTFAVEPGQRVALVGPSGAGKTTLMNLLPRLYDPDRGRILLDGYDLRDVTVESVREQIGLVAQDVQLFGASVAENLRYGRLDASDAEVRAAAEAANALDFIEALPEGFSTPIGERGIKLSGGQRQRLAIARALLKDPRLLLLDEATSALDAESERLVQEALGRLLEGRTAFVIAHRLATVRHADRILVLDGGRIVQDGTHAALVAEDGLYRRLAELQFRSEAAPGAGSEPVAA
ncbi:MAG: ABC transporter transmembrane domain-containing protein [Rhodothermales bacterium]|nr:ABC transporter transmembrane domain-containing protein [Rhodothermales bacterium]